jgi:hypothetical protein
VLALGLLVVLPDVPLGVKPTVKTRIANPHSETAKEMLSHSKSKECSPRGYEKCLIAIKKRPIVRSGKKLLHLNNQFPVDSNLSFRSIKHFSDTCWSTINVLPTHVFIL